MDRIVPKNVYNPVANKHLVSGLFGWLVVFYVPSTVRSLKDKYPNFKVGLKCILTVNPYLLVCSYIK